MKSVCDNRKRYEIIFKLIIHKNLFDEDSNEKNLDDRILVLLLVCTIEKFKIGAKCWRVR